MHEHPSPRMQRTQRGVAFRVRRLLDELHLLMGSFPDLHDAFDPDELPLAFILRRDAGLMKAGLRPRQSFSLRGNDSVRPRTMPSRTRGRRGRRKQMSDK